MMQFVGRRSLQIGVVLLLLAVMTFVLLHIAPGGPAQALLGPDQVAPEQQAAVERRLGLDLPIGTQLLKWIAAVATGDFGVSYFYRQPALSVVFSRMPSTLVLGSVAAGIAMVVGIPAGIAASRKPGGILDRIARSSAIVLVALPAFWLGILLIFTFSVQLGWAPSSGTGRDTVTGSWLPDARHLVLPAITMALPTAATFMLYTRSAMLEALTSDSIRTARGMGLRESKVQRLHAFRQALGPLLMQIGLYLPHLVEGSIVVESVFSWPGIGQLTTASVGRRDYPILLTLTIVLGAGTLLASTLTDFLHARLDPRIDLR